MAFTFYNLTPGEEYNITLDDGLSFTGYASGTEQLPGGIATAPAQATFTAPSEGLAAAGSGGVSFTLGVVVSASQVSGTTDLEAPEVVIVSLLDGVTSGQGGTFQLAAWGQLPTTCVMLNPAGIDCPVCALDSSKCPEATALGKQFYLAEHCFLCCSEPPGG